MAKKYASGSLKNIFNDLGRAFLRKQISLHPKKSSILDLGCGTGLDLQFYRSMGFTKLYGIDPSQKSLNEARKILPKNIELKSGTFEKIPYKKGFFDIVSSRHALHYSKDISLSLAEVSRVLKKGGKFIAVISHPFADALEKRDKKGNVSISLFGGEVHIAFPLHKLSDYFSKEFFEQFDLKGIYEYEGKERDGKTKNLYNTLCFIAVKK